MPKGGNPKHTRPHRIPIGSRVFIVENWIDPYHIKVDSSDYSGRTRKKLNSSKAAKMLSDHFRNGNG